LHQSSPKHEPPAKIHQLELKKVVRILFTGAATTSGSGQLFQIVGQFAKMRAFLVGHMGIQFTKQFFSINPLLVASPRRRYVNPVQQISRRFIKVHRFGLVGFPGRQSPAKPPCRRRFESTWPGLPARRPPAFQKPLRDCFSHNHWARSTHSDRQAANWQCV